MADENKVEYKHRPKNDYKHHSRNDYNSKSKSKNKDERRTKKSGGFKKKSRPRAMVAGASDVDSSSCYTSSISSSEEEDEGRHKGRRHTSKNFNGLSCITRGDFCGMAHSSRSKKEDSDSDS